MKKVGLYKALFLLFMVTFSGLSFSSESLAETTTGYKNNLREHFQNNEAVIYELVIRTFNAKDLDGDGLINPAKGEVIGNFTNAIERLDELQKMGINTLHLLPVMPPGKTCALGNAGSVYATTDFLALDPRLDDPKNPASVKEEARNFINECHKRNIHVMFDIPCCASIDLFKKHPEYFQTDSKGTPIVPADWSDVRLLSPVNLADGTLNEKVYKLHQDFIDMALSLGVDGIRSDVTKLKSNKFWEKLISYARSKDPAFTFLSESFTDETHSPVPTLPPDSSTGHLQVGFDAIYGKWNSFYKEMQTATQFHEYMISLLDLSKKLPAGKSTIGSFTTHDEQSPILLAGPLYSKLITGLQATLPMVNPYFVSGFETGAVFKYDYAGKPVDFSDTDAKTYFVHQGRLDIFNFASKPAGKYTELQDFIKEVLDIRRRYNDVITRGYYVPLKVKDNNDDKIIAYARFLDGKALIIFANRDLDKDQTGTIVVPGMNNKITLPEKLLSSNEGSCKIDIDDGEFRVKLAPNTIHIYSMDIPYLDRKAEKIYRQNLPVNN